MRQYMAQLIGYAEKVSDVDFHMSQLITILK